MSDLIKAYEFVRGKLIAAGLIVDTPVARVGHELLEGVSR
jgi:hypothetical protein